MTLLTTAEVAARLRVSVATVNRYARDGVLAAIQLPGKQRRYRPADVDALLVTGIPEPADGEAAQAVGEK